MNSPRQQEMDKLHVVQRQSEAVQQRLAQRLPQQRHNLVTFVCAIKWRLQTLRNQRPDSYTHELLDATSKKLRMEVGAFEYAVKEQSELLTRSLFQLDDILSHGDSEIKDARKALVVTIQQLLERADELNAKAASLKKFTESLFSRLPGVPATDVPMADVAEEEPSPVASTESVAMEGDNVGDDDWEHVDASDVKPLFEDNEDEEDEAEEKEEEEQEEEKEEEEQEEEKEEEEPPMILTPSPATDGDTIMEEAAQTPEHEVTAQEDGNEEDEDEDEEEEEEEEEQSLDDGADHASADESLLPVWRPYYQIQKRADGIYILANLRGVDPRHIRVESIPQHGVLRISGVKYPTQKDVLLSHLSGAPTFGRFEIVERFPTDRLSLENASQQLSQDGTLQVRLPFYFVQHPRILRRVNPFQPNRLVVW